MKLKSLFNVSIAALLSGAMLVMVGCNPTGGTTAATNVTTPAIENCSELNGDKAKCNSTTQKNGDVCEYDDAASVCKVKPAADVCAGLVADKDGCEASKVCTWDNAKDPKCAVADASVKNKCDAIQAKTPCNGDTTCKWDGTVCKDKSTFANKNVTVYDLNKIATADFGIESRLLKGLTTSKDGEVVYVVGTQAMQLKAFDVDNAVWNNPGDDWNAKFKKAEDHTAAGDLRVNTIEKFAATSDGIAIQLNANAGVVLIKKIGGFVAGPAAVAGGTDTSLFAHAAGNLANGVYQPFFATSAAGSHVYLLKSAGSSVLFKDYVAPPADDNVAGGSADGKADGAWNNSLAGFGGALAVNFTAAAQDAAGNMYLGHTAGVDVVAAADVGVDGKATAAAPTLNAAALIIDGVTATANDQGITSMAVVGNYLLVGLTSSAPGNGGLVVKDLNAGTVTAFGNGLTVTVNSITANAAADRALVATDKGFAIFENGTLIEPVATKGKLANHAYIDANKADSKNYDTAASGFAGDVWDAAVNDVVGAGVDKNGRWYIAVAGAGADDAGVYTLDIQSKVVTP